MQNTSRRFSFGLLALFVVALIVFLVTMLSKKKKTSQLPRPQRNNNPFALIQKVPNKWYGLIGTDAGKPEGFLTFDDAVNGVRAGFINLFNAYYHKGIRSIGAIAHKYVGGDLQGIEAWEKGVSSISGFGIDQQLSWPQFFHLGRAIERFENGYEWVSKEDFVKGYNLATAYTNAR